jgi:N-acetylmuramic acid 6-phosphate etherase
MTQADRDSLARLATEQVRPELRDLDGMSAGEIVERMTVDARRAPDAVIAAGGQIARAVEAIVARLERGGRLVYVGAGTAGRLGVLDASEARPTFSVPPGQVVAVLAGGMAAFSDPVEDAEDDAAAAVRALEALGVTGDDAVVGISASGQTPFVLAAVSWARARGALTVGVACNVDAPLSEQADVAIEIPVGPEFIAGSTRLNAGTAQKIVLNILSTATMVRLGKTYGNLMVDLRANNEKLRDRAVRIVSEITAASGSAARAALEASDWETKVAVLMLMGGVDARDARARLGDARGRLRAALEALGDDGDQGRERPYLDGHDR